MEWRRKGKEARHLADEPTQDEWWLSPLEPKFKIRLRDKSISKRGTHNKIWL